MQAKGDKVDRVVGCPVWENAAAALDDLHPRNDMGTGVKTSRKIESREERVPEWGRLQVTGETPLATGLSAQRQAGASATDLSTP